MSGMNSIEMVEENCKTADEAVAGHFTENDFKLLEKVTKQIHENEKVGCTGCRYCMPCPKNVDIPGIFRCYNAMYTESKNAGRFEFAQTVGLTKEPAFASQCIECGKCEKHCPQNIPIREKLKEADKALRPFPFKVGINIARKYMLRKVKRRKIAVLFTKILKEKIYIPLIFIIQFIICGRSTFINEKIYRDDKGRTSRLNLILK